MTPKKNCPALKILVIAGPTREYLDPVRFISNASTGTIGYALAGLAKERKHQVTLISGPTCLQAPQSVKTVAVVSAQDMFKAAEQNFKWADVVICAAAVSDYRPEKFLSQKLKKSQRSLSLKLVKNPDILYALGQKKKDKILVGFALETENTQNNAREKMLRKNLDFIVANTLDQRNNPFGENRFSAYLIDSRCALLYNNLSKKKLARIILDRVEKLCYSFS